MNALVEEEERRRRHWQKQGSEVDVVLAALGYKVCSSDMAYVAQKLEQLEAAMTVGAADTTAAVPFDAAAAQNDGTLPTEAVHYNPSDLSTWLENMLSEFSTPSALPPPVPSFFSDRPLPSNHRHRRHDRPQQRRGHVLNPPPPPPPQSCLFLSHEPTGPSESSGITTVDLPSPPSIRSSEHPKKRIKCTASPSTPARPPPGGLPLRSNSATMVDEEATVGDSSNTSGVGVPVDSPETGIQLVHALLGCADAVQRGNLKAADSLVKQIGTLVAMSQGGAMKKVATYFAEALARRIYRITPRLDTALSDALELHFYEACPYLKFAHFTANQAILEAFAGKSRVHVIDLGMRQGMQWPALMQALALRSEGPPFFRLTGIGPPQPDNTDALRQVGWRLAQLAQTMHVDFEYRGFVANSLADLEPDMLDARVDKKNNGSNSAEAVAINAVLELHRLLGRPGAAEKVLGTARAINPKVVTIVEAEANHNGPVFCNRFTESLHYYSTMFDSLEGSGVGATWGDTSPQLQQDRSMTEVYLGRQICDVVACEGRDRTERHETTEQWRSRMVGAGFEAVPLGSDAFKQASMLLELFTGGHGYRVEERDGCLMLGWHARPLITTSAWRPSSTPPPLPTAGHGRHRTMASVGIGESPFPA